MRAVQTWGTVDMAAAWITDASVAMIREMAVASESNAAIAMAISKTFGHSVNPNMVAGRIARMKDLPPRSRDPKKPDKRELFDWVPAPRPAWGTAEADAIVAKAKARFITSYKISKFFEVSDSSVMLALRRADALPDLTDIPKEMHPFLPYVTEEWPLDRLSKLVKVWIEGRPYREIMEVVHATHSAVQKKVERLAKAGLLKARPMVAAGHRPAKNAGRSVETQSVHRPLGSANGGRTAHHLGTLLNWRVINETKITHVPGHCRWPLSCSEPTNGKWCVHHAGLLGRRAA